MDDFGAHMSLAAKNGLGEAKCVFSFYKTSVKIGALIRAKRDLELELRGV